MLALRNSASKELFDLIECKSFESVIDGNMPTLYEASSGSDKDHMKTLLYVSYAIVNYLEFNNVRSTMNDRQIMETADIIISEFPYLHLDDLKLFVRKLKANSYGEVYNLNGQAFIGWLRKYIEEKREAIYRISQERERARKAAEEKELDEYYKTPEARANIERMAEIVKGLSDGFNVNRKSPEKIKEEAMRKIRLRVIQLNYNRLLKEEPENYETEIERLVQIEWEKYQAKQKGE